MKAMMKSPEKSERGFVGIVSKIPMKRAFTGIVGTYQTPLIEHTKENWLIWLSYNNDRTEGIYLRLHKDGSITREALAHDGSVSNISTIKPVDKRNISTIKPVDK